MTRYDKRVQTMAIFLAATAGFVDAIGFIELGGFFVSFMSGNSTRLGVGIAERGSDAATAALLILAFLVGVMGGSLAGHAAKAWRRPAVLVLVAALLAVAALASGFGLVAVAAAAMALAMGAENAVFERDGEVTVGLTYMTGALVKFGQGVVRSLLGRDRFGWTSWFFLWLGLASGAVAGAITYPLFGAACIWAASGATLLFAGLFALVDRERPELPTA